LSSFPRRARASCASVSSGAGDGSRDDTGELMSSRRMLFQISH
jgi:hypothetical protein